ncbi:MAG: rRNA maturation RNase YbeY [Myxococcales bacterium]|nr:rRNA maturation RNase YbeY [Myxococcales bacterium]
MIVTVRREGQTPRTLTNKAVDAEARCMLRALKLPRAELSVVLCDDPTIHQLNKQYRKKNKPTDVLAFALREGPAGHLAGDALGDVVISLETAARQARERKVTVKEEVRMLLAHGLLHLLGWDHQTDDEDAAMRAETERLMAAVARWARRNAAGA